jgi:hypothetical protein
MKGLKTLMTVIAFALAISGAFGFKSHTHSRLGGTGWVNLGSGTCSQALVPGICGTTGTQICTVGSDTYYQHAGCSDAFFLKL